eukprot:TRINITY_DN247_c0_g1_i1.p1 TRINITY_DN247_c0_g1~~TRINITY_DN247_c0_g1_i1.p1  ORF type:complete len:1771 (+),score=365.19 TRINITY_DN247_c0_g1_i1:318-5630(+)
MPTTPDSPYTSVKTDMMNCTSEASSVDGHAADEQPSAPSSAPAAAEPSTEVQSDVVPFNCPVPITPIRQFHAGIVGRACRLPGQACSPDALWRILRSGTNCIDNVPQARLPLFPDEDADGSMPSIPAGFLHELNCFTCEDRWNSSSMEDTDYHVRQLLDLVYEVLGDAGISQPPQSMGLFSSAGTQTFRVPMLPWVLPRSLASALNIDGPFSNTEHAECACGYLAMYHALDHLAAGKCDTAVVTAAQLFVRRPPADRLSMFKSRIMRPYDAKASGAMFGEACAAVLLERNTQDPSRMYGKLEGWSANYTSALTPLGAPDSQKMTSAAQGALAMANVQGGQIKVVHPHGMGNPASDSPEFQGLFAALKEGRESHLLVAGFKANFGHSMLASGLIAVVLTTLVGQHRQVPRHINVTKVMKQIRDAKVVDLPIHAAADLEPKGEILMNISGTSVSGDNVNMVLRHESDSNFGRGQIKETVVSKLETAILEAEAAAALIEESKVDSLEELQHINQLLLRVQNEMLTAPRSIKSGLRERAASLDRRVSQAVFVRPTPPTPQVSVPTLTKPGYFTNPTMAELQAFSSEQLCAVSDFKIENTEFGSLQWVAPVNLTGVDLDHVEIVKGRAGLDSALLPSLDSKCNVTLKNMLPKHPSKNEAYGAKLQRHVVAVGAKFLGYDATQGHLKFEVQHFSVYDMEVGEHQDDPRAFQANPASIKLQSNPLVDLSAAREDEQAAIEAEEIRETQAMVRAIVNEQIGVGPGQQGPDLEENLWGVGLSSSSAATMKRNFEAQFGVQIDMLAVLEDFSIAGLARLLAADTTVAGVLTDAPADTVASPLGTSPMLFAENSRDTTAKQPISGGGMQEVSQEQATQSNLDLVNALVREKLELGPDEVGPDMEENLWGCGLSSASAATMKREFEDRFNVHIDMLTIMEDFSIAGLAKFLSTADAGLVSAHLEVQKYQAPKKHHPAPVSSGITIFPSPRSDVRTPPKVKAKSQVGISMMIPDVDDSDSDDFEEFTVDEATDTSEPLSGLQQTLWAGCVFILLSCVTGWAMAPIFALNDSLDPEDISIKIVNYKPAVTVRLATWKLLVLLPIYHLMFCFVVAVTTICAKWTVIGRFHHGKHVLWGWYFCRCKLVENLLMLCHTYFGSWLSANPLACTWYRLLGAEVGDSVWIGDVHFRGGHDLVEIGSGSCLEDGVDIAAQGVCYDGNFVECGRIVVGRNVTVLERSVLLPECHIGDCTIVGIRELVSSATGDNTVVGTGTKAMLHPAQNSFCASCSLALGYLLVVVVFEASIFVGVGLLDEINVKLEYIGKDTLILFPVFLMGFMFAMMTLSIVVKWIVLGRVEQCTEPITLQLVWRFQFMHVLLNICHRMALQIFMWSPVCNLYAASAGADVDLRSTYLSDLSHLTVQLDLLTIGRTTFVAGNVSLRCTVAFANNVEFKAIAVGAGCYVGNGSVVCPGCTMADLMVVGDFAVLHADTDVPRLSMVLGKSRVITRTLPAALEHTVTAMLEKKPRIGFLFTRIMTSVYCLFALTTSILLAFEVMFQIVSETGNLEGLGFFDAHKFFGFQPAQFCFVWRPVVGIVLLAASGICVFLHKWLLVGKLGVGPGHAPHDMDSGFFLAYWLCSALWMVFSGLLAPFAGTPFASFMFHIMGSKVGHNSRIFTVTVLCDFDAFVIDDNAYIGEGVFMQCHSFLGGGLVYGPIHVGAGAVVVGCSSVFVSDTALEPESVVGPCSTIMRGESVVACQRWQGNPAQLVKPSRQPPPVTVRVDI